MTAIEATNRGLADMPWAMLTSSPDVPEVDLAAMEARAPETLLLDVREPEEYAHGHAPGAVNIPQAELASRLEEVPRDRPILTICQAGMRSLRAAQFLAQMGYAQVASVAGGTGAWIAAGKPVDIDDTSLAPPRIAESEWTHAGALSYSI
jgi:rhodanese-related sulfurtransferase